MPDSVPEPVCLIAVCHTDGCPAAGQECVGVYYPYGDYDPPRYLGQCGPCGQPITDLRPCSDPVPQPPAESDDVPMPVPVAPAPVEEAA